MGLRTKTLILRLLVGVILLLPIAADVYNFYDYPISKDPSDWTDFAGYIGGVYSVLIAIYVVYLARNLKQKDEVLNKRRKAVEEIYIQIQRINIKNIDLRSVNKIYNIVNKYRLYLPDKLCGSICELADHFQEVKAGTSLLDNKILSYVRNTLKDMYEV